MADRRVVILISANSEWRAVRQILPGTRIERTRMGEQFHTTLEGWKVLFMHGGWGKVSAATTAQFAIDHFHPNLLVNLGTCGGFQGRIERGTILLVTRTIIYDIIEQMNDPEEAIAHYMSNLDLSWLGGEPPFPVVRSLLVSADRDILAGDIPMLVEKYGAVAADWESGAIAWVAKKNGVRCLILRGVSDLVGAEGGEAYKGNVALFLENTKTILSRLIEGLPAWLAGVRW